MNLTELESRLNQIRSDLDYFESNMPGPDDVQKAAEMRQELARLEGRVNGLRMAMDAASRAYGYGSLPESESAPAGSYGPVMAAEMTGGVSGAQQAQNARPGYAYNPAYGAGQASVPPGQPAQWRQAPGYAYHGPVKLKRKPREKKDIEKFIGQSVMGVLAALLIFISMGVFAVMILPVLPVELRMLLLYAASGAVTFFGLRRMKSKPGRMASVISGIGVGAVYVSIFLTRIVFFLGTPEMDLPMYVLLFAWCVWLLKLARKHSGPFEAIAHIGTAVTFLFGMAMMDLTGMYHVMPILVCFFFISEAACLLAFYKLGQRLQTAPISMTVCMTGFWAVSAFYNSPWNAYETVTGADFYLNLSRIMMAGAGIMLSLLVLLRRKRGGLSGIIQDAGLSVSFCILAALLDSAGMDWMAAMLAMAIACGTVWLDCYDKQEPHIFTLVLSFISFIYARDMLSVGSIGVLVLIPIFFVAVQRHIRIVEGLCAGLMIFSRLFAVPVLEYDAAGEMLTSVALGIAAGFVIWAALLEERHDYMRSAAYIITAITITGLIDSGFNMAMELAWDADGRHVLITVSEMLISTALFLESFAAERVFPHGCKWVNGNKSLMICMGATQVGIMLTLLGCVTALDTHPFLHMLAVLMAAACFVYRYSEILKYKYGGLYVGLKFAVLIYVVLGSFSAPNYLISIGFFMLAVWSVISGFRSSVKSLRTFGLLLSCISVCKLILSDLTFASTGAQAGSFLICGLLCLGINYVYNRMAKADALRQAETGQGQEPESEDWRNY